MVRLRVVFAEQTNKKPAAFRGFSAQPDGDWVLPGNGRLAGGAMVIRIGDIDCIARP
jgi:hypothetical protein